MRSRAARWAPPFDGAGEVRIGEELPTELGLVPAEVGRSKNFDSLVCVARVPKQFPPAPNLRNLIKWGVIGRLSNHGH